jgi:hypothetical protein
VELAKLALFAQSQLSCVFFSEMAIFGMAWTLNAAFLRIKPI